MNKKLLIILIIVSCICCMACNNTQVKPNSQYHDNGFEGEYLFLNYQGNTYKYHRTDISGADFTKKELLGCFEEETRIEGIAWEIWSVEEHPDLSYVYVISGTNSEWVCIIE